MPDPSTFETHSEQYDRWFDQHPAAYRSEIAAVSRLVPADAFGVEVGVGSGRFAEPLGVDVGIDPAAAMLERATKRGITPIRGVAEALPLGSNRFDLVLLVTTICFVDDVAASLREAQRVLRPGGDLVVGYVDADSPLGQQYGDQTAENPFYREATFHSTEDLQNAVQDAGFESVDFVQTVFSHSDDMDAPDPVRAGHTDGSFVVLRAVAPR